MLPESVMIGGEPVQEDKYYSMCVKSYLALGKDGYTMLPECKVISCRPSVGSAKLSWTLQVLMDSEVAPVLPALVRNYLTSLAGNNNANTGTSPSPRRHC